MMISKYHSIFAYVFSNITSGPTPALFRFEGPVKRCVQSHSFSLIASQENWSECEIACPVLSSNISCMYLFTCCVMLCHYSPFCLQTQDLVDDSIHLNRKPRDPGFWARWKPRFSAFGNLEPCLHSCRTLTVLMTGLRQCRISDAHEQCVHRGLHLHAKMHWLRQC